MNHASDRLWRSLEEAGGNADFIARVSQEFPNLAASLAAPIDRRRALKLMAASLLMNGLPGCDSKLSENLIPAVRVPSNIVPALQNSYATAHVLGGYATGIVVSHYMGRPVKVAGNPHHPASLGAIDAFAQASLLNFYDPDRAAEIAHRGIPAARADFETALAAQRLSLGADRGAGLRILTGTVTSPTLIAQIRALLEQYPRAQWTQWEPISRDAVMQGAQLAYGRPLELIPRLEQADILVAIDSDLLCSAPGRLRYAREFAQRRNPNRTHAMSRIYAIEPTPTLLGSVADHRFIAGPAQLAHILVALAAGIVDGASAPDPARSLPDWIVPLLEDMKGARGRILVHVGASQPAELHALAHAINDALGGRGVSFDLIEPVSNAGSAGQPLRSLIAEMQSGRVQNLLIIDSNPLYSAPAAWNFEEALRQVSFSVALAQHPDETAQAAAWFVPQTHDWETWSDARAFDGTASILQPQALPLYDGLGAVEMLELYRAPAARSAEQVVRGTWKRQFGDGFDAAWHESLATGVVPDTACAKSGARLRALPAQLNSSAPINDDAALTVLLRPDPSLWDGRFANNPWLQELPRPLTKLVWDNPLLIAPALAARLHLENGDLARVTVARSSVTAPVWIMPGQAPECITAWLGSGRRAAGSIGDGQGIDYYPLTQLPGAATLQKQPGHVRLASTVHHNLLLAASQEVLRHGTLSDYLAHPGVASTAQPEPHIYRTAPPGAAAWAMSIDLNACIGCNACIVACQAENNISVVGKDQVLAEREMHWLRIDRYFAGDPDAPESFFQPVLCMHCEQAPCENVCPVGATVHDSEGLNVMVYNRCVGTRFCSNNCPYKVRRFNFLPYAREQHRPPQSWNPDVTVRVRGVMEKCSYCVQRIAEARIAADRESRPIGAVRTACQSACPTRAFTFGNSADPDSEVARRKSSPLNFSMLERQGTAPRTTYEALIRNPNPAIGAGRKAPPS
ncbi:MAG TPA: TAT-variant-translocated molybdopterin oxidoreductase [Steroidobacteraceae bacterium]|jgi:molybdopterin-containing oxidoreductase family iron-sulfur binding subunit|nr:TAT-variant-translocated molybdopterin oxidoreductase [Steroidobacteraceae bacterium]